MEENKNEYIMRKVYVNSDYKVNAQTTATGKTFYKLNVYQKQADGQVSWFKVPVTFANGVEVPDGCKIKIKQAIENFYYTNADTKKFNPIYSLYVKEFEIVEKLVQNFAEQLNSMSDDDLPF